jgi:acyl carrier protein
MYGPTETTVWSTVEKVSVDENDKTGYINLGKPIDNTFVYVLNTEFQPVPIGYPGELFIGGDGLAKGYFNLPEMTRDRFLPDPFSGRAGDRMYRTGDLVQQTEEGKLEFLNRVDSQVKIRGFRIELGEIESALTQFPTIGDNVVIVREDTPGDKKLVAYIIKKENQETDLPELRKYLRTKIPDYMVPSAFVFIDQFPLTPNGKIDRKVLPSPQDSAQPEEKEYVAPITDTEIKLAAIWCEILKAKRVGVDENFFEIGGHSMIAVTLMVKIEKEMGVRLPLAILFDHSTVRDMALVLDKKTEPINWGSLVPIRAKGLDGVDEPLNTIEEIAEYYNSEILKVDNSGSYALAGFSVGGQLAYEMAKQLGMKGKKVSFLGVFDTVSENASDLHIPLFKRYYLRAPGLLDYHYFSEEASE